MARPVTTSMWVTYLPKHSRSDGLVEILKILSVKHKFESTKQKLETITSRQPFLVVNHQREE